MRHTNAQIAAMFKPVSCAHCQHGVYDIGKVEVTAGYSDCSMGKTPCCGVTVEDRGEAGWKTIQDYRGLEKSRLDPDDHRPWLGDIDVFGFHRG